MSRLIDADAFVEAIKGVEVSWYLDGNYTTYDETTIMDIIKQQPTVEAVPVVHGEWVNEYINRYGHPCHCCSVCGFHASHQDKNFCPECGADMRISAE